MATLLEGYHSRLKQLNSGMQIALPGPSDIWMQQELYYRVGVLETCQLFVKTAPKSAGAQDLCWHYQMVDAFFQNLTTERRYAADAHDILQKLRETAHGNLQKVIADYRKRFGSFTPGSDAECYRKTITNVIQTVLAAWIQYRQTYIEIIKEAA
jgi:hypothetical protein